MGTKISRESPSTLFKSAVYELGKKYQEGDSFTINRTWLGHKCDLYPDEIYYRRGWEDEQLELFKNGYYVYINKLSTMTKSHSCQTLATIYKRDVKQHVTAEIIYDAYQNRNLWILVDCDIESLRDILSKQYGIDIKDVREADVSNNLYWIKLMHRRPSI